jgi:hypothetical protein
MSFILYKDVIRELGIKFNYEAIVHILANPYMEKANEIVEQVNPFNISTKKIDNKPKRLTAKDLAKFGLEVPDS